MVRIGSLTVNPPLLNAACPYISLCCASDIRWASTKEDLSKLYQSNYTGAVTTRTSLLSGFAHDDTIHQHAFFGEKKDSSINSYGYSPFSLNQYIAWINEIHAEHETSSKPFIISITGTANDIEQCLLTIQQLRKDLTLPNKHGFDIGVEINLSCPNIPRVPPPAYSTESLLSYLLVTKRYYMEDPSLTMGLKLPPYTYETQFTSLISATWRKRTDSGIAFLTSTNTLGNGLVFNDQTSNDIEPGFAVSPGFGGLGGATIHSLSVGNVSKLVSLLETPTLATKLKLSEMAAKNTDGDTGNGIVVIAVGGVNSGTTFKHFMNVGAVACEVATAFGVEGIQVFERISKEVESVE
jgi:dihydroorotate dehydrogenase (fumarate)